MNACKATVRRRIAATDVRVVHGVHRAEDIVHVPGTRWIVASGLASASHPSGALHMVDTGRRVASTVDDVEVDLGAGIHADAADALFDAPDFGVLSAHGMALRPGSGAVHLLYVVNHGGREAIELFHVDARADRPRLRWVGAIAQQDGVRGNAVAPLPGGGVVSTMFCDLDDEAAGNKLMAGKVTGCIKEWDRDAGWTDMPGSTMSGANGVATSEDGAWVFAAAWGSGELIRLRRGSAQGDRTSLPLGFLPDNVSINRDGLVAVAGQAARPIEVLQASLADDPRGITVAAALVDPASMEVVDAVEWEHPEFGMAASMLELDGGTWFSSASGDAVAVVAGWPMRDLTLRTQHARRGTERNYA